MFEGILCLYLPTKSYVLNICRFPVNCLFHLHLKTHLPTNLFLASQQHSKDKISSNNTNFNPQEPFIVSNSKAQVEWTTPPAFLAPPALLGPPLAFADGSNERTRNSASKLIGRNAGKV